MQTDPNTSVRPPVTVEEFNKQMLDWTFTIRAKAQALLRMATAGSSGKGVRSISPSLKYQYGEAYSTGFKFSYYLVFVHYGVGRGYIHQNDTVVRGHRSDNNKFRMYRGQPAKTWKDYSSDNRPVQRVGFDWIDTEIRNGIEKLADIAADYHGDKAAASVTKQQHKLLIDKSKTNGK